MSELHLIIGEHRLTLRGSVAMIYIGVFTFFGASDPAVHLYVLDNAGRTVGINKKFPSPVRTTGRAIPFRSHSVPV